MIHKVVAIIVIIVEFVIEMSINAIFNGMILLIPNCSNGELKNIKF